MKSKILITIFASLFLGFSAITQAALIEYNGYQLSTDTNIVTAKNLEWLQWDETLDLSINEALLANAGWSLASNLQMSTLYSSFFSANTWTTEETDHQFYRLDFDADDIAMLNFQRLFGTSLISEGIFVSGSGKYKNEYNFSDAKHVISAYYGSDENDDSLYNLASVRDKNKYTAEQVEGNGRASGENGGMATLSSDYSNIDTHNSYIGVALVRNTQVPEPSSYAIFCLGFIGLLMSRRSKQTTHSITA